MQWKYYNQAIYMILKIVLDDRNIIRFNRSGYRTLATPKHKSKMHVPNVNYVSELIRRRGRKERRKKTTVRAYEWNDEIVY